MGTTYLRYIIRRMAPEANRNTGIAECCRGRVARAIGFEIGRISPGDSLVDQNKKLEPQMNADRALGICVLCGASAAVKASAGPSAARSQDFLYGEDGLP
jgi:hypothetical protein